MATLIDTSNVDGDNLSFLFPRIMPSFPNICRNFSEGLTVFLVVDFCKLMVIINFTFMGCEKYCDTGTVSCHLAESVDACVLDFNALLVSLMPINLLDSFNSGQC